MTFLHQAFTKQWVRSQWVCPSLCQVNSIHTTLHIRTHRRVAATHNLLTACLHLGLTRVYCALRGRKAQIHLHLCRRCFYLWLFMRALLREIILQPNYAVIMETLVQRHKRGMTMSLLCVRACVCVALGRVTNKFVLTY